MKSHVIHGYYCHTNKIRLNRCWDNCLTLQTQCVSE